MGGSFYQEDVYQQRVRANQAAGRDTFDYGKTARKVHSLLDPKRVASARSPFAGKVMRECAVSDEHPQPTPIVIGLDVTASNSAACYATHAKLPKLFTTLQRCVTDPQIMMAAIGDANCDRFPLQVGDFESDNRVDEQIEAIILEMGGGGQHHETYELLLYFLVQHTMLQSFYTQRRKGYVFLIGDEMPYDMVRCEQVRRIIGDDIERDISTKEIVDTLSEQYNVFFLFQRQGGHTESQVMPTWRKLLGENALILDDPNNVCEVIAGIVSMREGNIKDWDTVSANLRRAGFDSRAIASASTTLQRASM